MALNALAIDDLKLVRGIVFGITPVIDRTYPLTDAAAAVRLAEEGSPAGKVVVVVEPPPPRLPPR